VIMLQGEVRESGEAVLQLSIRGPQGHDLQIEALIDTGFTGYLCLPETLVTALGLPYCGAARAMLADGSRSVISVYAGTIVWENQPRQIEIDATGCEALIGIGLLRRHELRIRFMAGGEVSITPIS